MYDTVRSWMCDILLKAGKVRCWSWAPFFCHRPWSLDWLVSAYIRNISHDQPWGVFCAYATRKCGQRLYRCSLLVCSFVCLSGQILLPKYLVNGLNDSIKLTGNIHWPLPMIPLDSGGHRSRSQLAIEVSMACQPVHVFYLIVHVWLLWCWKHWTTLQKSAPHDYWWNTAIVRPLSIKQILFQD